MSEDWELKYERLRAETTAALASRDAEIAKLKAEVERLTIENIQMKFALGYPMPADLERHIIPGNPFKCGTCDARAARDAEVAELQELINKQSDMHVAHVKGLHLTYETERDILTSSIAALRAEVERLRGALGRVRDETLNGKSDGIVDRIYAIVSGALHDAALTEKGKTEKSPTSG
jgi:hypothetical protein